MKLAEFAYLSRIELFFIGVIVLYCVYGYVLGDGLSRALSTAAILVAGWVALVRIRAEREKRGQEGPGA